MNMFSSIKWSCLVMEWFTQARASRPKNKRRLLLERIHQTATAATTTRPSHICANWNSPLFAAFVFRNYRMGSIGMKLRWRAKHKKWCAHQPELLLLLLLLLFGWRRFSQCSRHLRVLSMAIKRNKTLENATATEHTHKDWRNGKWNVRHGSSTRTPDIGLLIDFF